MNSPFLSLLASSGSKVPPSDLAGEPPADLRARKQALDHLRSMAIFAQVVETGSLRGAAAALGMSPSVISHHLTQLEAGLKVALLHRSTRQLTLTPEGRKVFEAARQMIGLAEGALGDLSFDADSPSGHLSVAVPAALLVGGLFEDLAAFAVAFPRVALTVHHSDAPVDIIRQGVDVAIRSGNLPGSNLRAKRLFQFSRKLVASPRYLETKPVPHNPQDLAGWEWIRLGSRPSQATFVGVSGRRVEVQFSSRLVVNSADAMVRLAQEGLGLAVVPEAMTDAPLASNQLVEVLTDWWPEPISTYALWAPSVPRRGLAMRFVAFLEKRLASSPERKGDLSKDAGTAGSATMR